MTSGIFIQARLASTRLPAKALLDLNGKTVLERVVNRCKLSKLPVYILTTNHYSDDVIEAVGNKMGIAGVYRGSPNNVRSRFFEAAKFFQIKKIIRVTADNPFTEPEFFHVLLGALHSMQYCRIRDSDCPDGVNSEAFTFELLKESLRLSQTPEDLEHVTPWMRKFQTMNDLGESIHSARFQKYPESYSLHLGIDTFEDYCKILNLCKRVPEQLFESPNLLDYLLESIFKKRVIFKIGRRYSL